MEYEERRAPEDVWAITAGSPESAPSGQATFLHDGTENLTYNNPSGLEVERVWFDGKVVFAAERGEIELEFDEDRRAVGNEVAQEYRVVCDVRLDERGKPVDGHEPERVEIGSTSTTRCPAWTGTRRCGNSTTSSSIEIT